MCGRIAGGLHDGPLTDAAAVDKAIDAAVAAVAARRGVSVALPSAGGGGAGPWWILPPWTPRRDGDRPRRRARLGSPAGAGTTRPGHPGDCPSATADSELIDL